MSARGLSPRFWKFRMRGYTTDRDTLGAIRRHASALFDPTATGRARFDAINSLVLVAPKEAETREDIDLWFRQLRAHMRRDRCGDLFDRFVTRRVRDLVTQNLLKRAAPKAAEESQ
jgi:hypothetical protein